MLALAFATVLSLAIIAPVASAAPTRAEYIAQVDPICQQVNSNSEVVLADYERAYHAAKYVKAARIYDRVMDALEGAIFRISQIEPPAEDATLIAQWLTLNREHLAKGREQAEALRRLKFRKFRGIVRERRAIRAQIQGLMTGYGFTYCAFQGED